MLGIFGFEMLYETRVVNRSWITSKKSDFLSFIHNLIETKFEIYFDYFGQINLKFTISKISTFLSIDEERDNNA